MKRSKLSIILVGEREFGRHGIEGASLRQISEAAGYKNVYAAQYHFRDKAGLIDAILRYRRPQMDQARAAYLAEKGISIADATVADLVRCLFEPVFQQKDGDGIRSFCRFQQSLFSAEGFEQIWQQTDEVAPLASAMFGILRGKLKPMSDAVWNTRRVMLGVMGSSAIADYDRMKRSHKLSETAFLDELLNLMTAAFEAPGDL